MNRLCLVALAVSISFGANAQAREVGAEIPRPEDGGRNYLTVFGDVEDGTLRLLRAGFPGTHFSVYRESDPLAERYRPFVGEFPAVVYQEPSGRVIQKRSGRNFPANSIELTGFVNDCKPCRPSPTPEPAPVKPEPPVAPPVVVVPDSPSQPDGPPIGLYFLVFGASVAVGAGYSWYKEVYGE